MNRAPDWTLWALALKALVATGEQSPPVRGRIDEPHVLTNPWRPVTAGFLSYNP
ncbi:MAG TPA: hypothetical protein PKY50_03440 [Candidatus Competibacter sp.]|nr:hypothetical protein [Candidatus Competibacter sp.]